MAKRSNPQTAKPSEPAGIEKSPPVSVPLPPEPTVEQARLLAAVSLSATFSAGPLPPPDVLKEYNEAVPDAAERILRMAEQQAAHRQKLEAKVVDSDIWKSYAGVVGAFVIVIAALVTAGLVAPHAGWPGAAAIAGPTITAVVVAFIYGTNSRRQERANRVAALTPPK